VELAGCGHCLTPGHFRGEEDPTRELAGGDVGFEVPGAGTVVGPNLTPDKHTRLAEETVRAVEAVHGKGIAVRADVPWKLELLELLLDRQWVIARPGNACRDSVSPVWLPTKNGS
jgi:hypothetical protein